MDVFASMFSPGDCWASVFLQQFLVPGWLWLELVSGSLWPAVWFVHHWNKIIPTAHHPRPPTNHPQTWRKSSDSPPPPHRPPCLETPIFTSPSPLHPTPIHSPFSDSNQSHVTQQHLSAPTLTFWPMGGSRGAHLSDLCFFCLAWCLKSVCVCVCVCVCVAFLRGNVHTVMFSYCMRWAAKELVLTHRDSPHWKHFSANCNFFLFFLFMRWVFLCIESFLSVDWPFRVL